MAQNGPSSAGPADSLYRTLQHCPALTNADKLLIAYSGGLDSAVLLHLLWSLQCNGELSGSLQVLHVNHGLQSRADDWETHCRDVAASLSLPFECIRVQVPSGTGESPEAAAREARYQAFTSRVDARTLLLQAHHLDDQAETILLHLFRGSGPRGLAGIPRQRGLGQASILRPLLSSSRQQMLDHARKYHLQWIEDDSNADQRYDRNFLRHSILPALQQRWPDITAKMALSASLCAEADDFSVMLADDDLQMLSTDRQNVLSLFALRQLDEARQRNVLRHWVSGLSAMLSGSSITNQALQSVITNLLPAGEDAQPCVPWGRGERRLELRRYQDELYLLKPVPDVSGLVLPWQGRGTLHLPGCLGSLTVEPALQASPALQVRFRSGGEKIHLVGRPTRPLKKLLQELGVPPWMREAVPLIYQGHELLAVADLVTAESWSRIWGGQKPEIRWQRSLLHCGY